MNDYINEDPGKMRSVDAIIQAVNALPQSSERQILSMNGDDLYFLVDRDGKEVKVQLTNQAGAPAETPLLFAFGRSSAEFGSGFFAAAMAQGHPDSELPLTFNETELRERLQKWGAERFSPIKKTQRSDVSSDNGETGPRAEFIADLAAWQGPADTQGIVEVRRWQHPYQTPKENIDHITRLILREWWPMLDAIRKEHAYVGVARDTASRIETQLRDNGLPTSSPAELRGLPRKANLKLSVGNQMLPGGSPDALVPTLVIDVVLGARHLSQVGHPVKTLPCEFMALSALQQAFGPGTTHQGPFYDLLAKLGVKQIVVYGSIDALVAGENYSNVKPEIARTIL